MPHVLAAEPATRPTTSFGAGRRGGVAAAGPRRGARRAATGREPVRQWKARFGPDEYHTLSAAMGLATTLEGARAVRAGLRAQRGQPAALAHRVRRGPSGHPTGGQQPRGRPAPAGAQPGRIRPRPGHADPPPRAARRGAPGHAVLGQRARGRPAPARAQPRGVRARSDTIGRRRALYGDDHADTLWSANGLAEDLRRLGRYSDAYAIDRDALARRRALLGEDHPDTHWSANASRPTCVGSAGTRRRTNWPRTRSSGGGPRSATTIPTPAGWPGQWPKTCGGSSARSSSVRSLKRGPVRRVCDLVGWPADPRLRPVPAPPSPRSEGPPWTFPPPRPSRHCDRPRRCAGLTSPGRPASGRPRRGDAGGHDRPTQPAARMVRVGGEHTEIPVRGGRQQVVHGGVVGVQAGSHIGRQVQWVGSSTGIDLRAGPTGPSQHRRRRATRRPGGRACRRDGRRRRRPGSDTQRRRGRNGARRDRPRTRRRTSPRPAAGRPGRPG